MNGSPLPPIDDAPPMSLEMFLGLALLVGIILALAWFLGVERELRRAREHNDKMRVTREAIEQHREELTQWLIENSPGGRKPWQDRRQP